MFRNIVVGTDGSETASIAVARAVEMAGLTGGTLHIVHAYQPVTSSLLGSAAVSGATPIDLGQVNASIEAGADEVLGHAANVASAAGVAVQTHRVPGDAADALVGRARDLDADLVVVGSRGMSGKRRFVLGSVPNKVSHHSPCSLLIVDTAERT
jgi:nucleotide-binding universal stress UspA family protein